MWRLSVIIAILVFVDTAWIASVVFLPKDSEILLAVILFVSAAFVILNILIIIDIKEIIHGKNRRS